MSDIVGYSFRSHQYCPSCILRVMDGNMKRRLNVISTPGTTVERTLGFAANVLGIDRNDERSFDSKEFPKIILRNMLNTNDECVECGEPSDTHFDAVIVSHSFVDPGDRCGNCGEVLR